jgi:hypothetical protein
MSLWLMPLFIMSASLKKKLALLLILILGACVRFVGIDWDQGQHLHPDERFLTMVGNAMVVPTSLLQYFNPHTSHMNPANINFTFYVYGTFPVVANKILAVFFNMDNYVAFTILGRILSALFDVLTILFVYKLMKLFEEAYTLKEGTALLAAFLYAIAVLPIQLAHFFAVDTFLTFFITVSVYFAVRYYFKPTLLAIIFSACALGFAIGTKINAVLALPLLFYFFVGGIFPIHKHETLRQFLHHCREEKTIKRFLLCIILFPLVMYTVLRIADPYLFENANFFSLQPSSLFLKNLEMLQSWNNAGFPPAVQWVHKQPVIFSLINLIQFGIGIPYAVFMLIGVYVLIKKIQKPSLLIILLWIVAFFLYQSVQFVKVMRYFIILYPFFACITAIGLSYILQKQSVYIWAVALLIISFWPASFLAIYLRPHSRVTASQWIYKHIPPGATVLSEYWDDALPLSFADKAASQYRIEELHVFDFDTPEKWQIMNQQLSSADYYILSSNRGWGSIPTVPEHYPQMSKFYADLFAGKTNYQKIAEFTSYPSIPPIVIPDQWADESFTVYDHPRVVIFKNTIK